MMKNYILDADHNPIEVDMLTWGRWYESAELHVAQTMINGIKVSTVFLGIDHNFGFDRNDTRPILYETMIFGGAHDEECWRYATWEEAEVGHAEVCEMVRAEQGEP